MSSALFRHRLSLPRILHSRRPFRPPKSSSPSLRLRAFTNNSQLLLVSPQTPRPQLPFLHTASGPASQSLLRTNIQYQVARYLTTEKKQWIKQEIKTGIKWAGYFYVGLFLVAVVYMGFNEEYLDRTYPSPPEWTFRSRNGYRNARLEEDVDPSTGRIIDRAKSGNIYRWLISRLEDPEIDGAGLHPILDEEGDIYVEGVGRTGLDISSKSEPWRRAYFECIMGAARAAESLDGWVRDTTRNIAFPREVVIGPSNPHPRPVPVGAKSAPSEENCIPAFEKPEVFYMKILTAHGFSSGQRLAAALAHGDWLEFKGLPSSAEEMYDWALDIAMGALPEGINSVVDNKTGIISANAEYMSSNILEATTALATHHARNGNLSSALPIFLSVLRARRQLSLSPAITSPQVETPPADNSMGFATMRWLGKAIFASPPYPPAPPSGDEIPLRTPASICEEAGLMAHIGEIFFASSNEASTSQKSTPQASGLSWTRDAVELAETTLAEIPNGNEEKEARKKCTECLEMGTTNWKMMVDRMLKDEKARKQKLPEAMRDTGSWFWGKSTSKEKDSEDVGRWEREAALVDSKVRAMMAIAISEEVKQRVPGSGIDMLKQIVGR
ncbi:hypothetical protein G7Y79_00008g023440 [Physcia stellaris]|nr:hypothetical protein G7Y79_00008g023440 [Physcia stellaris]